MLFLYGLFQKELSARIEKFQPDIIGYSFGSHQMSLAAKVINYIDEKHKIPSIIGGVHATVAPEECLSIEGVLGVCVGEGELALADFMAAYTKGGDFFKTNNFYFKKDGKIINKPPHPLIQDIDSLPFPDRKLFSYNPSTAMLGLEFIFSRGCPYKCSFCINPHLQKLYKGKGAFIRFRSPESAVKEIENTITLYSYKGMLTFHDDVFVLKKSWLKEFVHLYKKRVGLPYFCNVTADKVDEEVGQYLKESNCKKVFFGIETGSEELRTKLLNKKILDKDIIKAGKILNELGISIVSYNLLGIPGETSENIKRLIEINIKAGVEQVSVSFMQPYPGTEIYEQCKKDNILLEHNAATGTKIGIKYLHISDADLYKYFYLFKQLIFGGKYLKTINFLYSFSLFIWLRRGAQHLPTPVKKLISAYILK